MSVRALLLLIAIHGAFGRMGFGPTDQKWGYVTVRDGAHLFWWLHHTTADVSDFTQRPLIIWLQGGPGASSTGMGNFQELGPLDENLKIRPSAWTNDVNVLFVDNPVGTGFSYVERDDLYATNNTQIADDFLVLMKAFFEKNPEFVGTPLYIFTESYGGKMTVEISLKMYQAIQSGDLSCNLTAIALGDSWISPVDSILNYGPYLLNLGIIDQIGHDEIVSSSLKTKEFLEQGAYFNATDQWHYTMQIIALQTQNIDVYNVLTKIRSDTKRGPIDPNVGDALDDIMNGVVKDALELNVTWGAQSNDVGDALVIDILKPVTDIVEELLNNTNLRITVYSGELDLIVETPGTVAWVNRLKWDQKAEWDQTQVTPLINRGYVEGYYKKVGNLGLFLIDRAGHMVPADNPSGMEAILKDVTNNYAV